MKKVVTAKLVFSPLRKTSFYLAYEGGARTLPVEKHMGRFISSSSQFLYLPAKEASLLYGDLPLEGEEPVVIDRGRGIVYRITGVEQVHAFLSEDGRKKQRETLKVYETPEPILKKVVELSLSAIKRAFITELAEVKIGDKAVRAQELISEAHSLEGEKFWAWLLERWQDIRRVLSHNPYVLRMKEPRLLFFDPQAGSGALLDYLPKGSVLTGFEIREIEVKREGYKVITGVDSRAMFDALESIGWIRREDFPYGHATLSPISARARVGAFAGDVENMEALLRSLANSFIYLNPPYTGDGMLERETLSSLPADTEAGNPWFTSGLVFGLISAKDEYLLSHFKGTLCYWKVPRSATGYTDENTPEEFLFFVGIRGETKKDLYMGKVESLDEIELPDSLLRGGGHKHIIKCLHDMSFGVDALPKTLENIKESLKSEQLPSLEKALRPLSLEELAKRGEPVFPALNFYENGIFINFKELAGNPELLAIYREKYPYLYQVAKNVSQDLGIPLASVEREKEEYSVAPPERMGLLKFKHLPTIIELNDKVKEVLRSMTDSEELSALLSKSKYVWVKSVFTSTTATGEESFGFYPVLALADERGVSLGKVDVSIDEFYQRLVQEGVINLNVKHISQHPEYKNALKELILRFVEEFKEIFDEDEKALIEQRRKEGKEIGEISAEVYEVWKEKRKDFVNRFFRQEVKADALAGAYSVLKIRNKEEEWEKVKKVLSEFEELYDKYPVNFLSSLFSSEGEFAQSYLNGKSVKLALKERLLKEGLDALLADDISSVFASKYDVLRELIENSILSVEKLVRAYLIAPKLKDLAEKDLDRAYDLFRDLHIKNFGLLPHQFDEGLFVALKAYITKESGHLLGWEMRSGKTLAMSLAVYFSSLLNSNKSYMFVRSANLYDITKQIIFFLPHMAKDMAIYPSQELAEKVFSPQVSFRALSPSAYVNIFKNPKLFKRRGNAVEEFLKDNAFMQIERYAREGIEEKEVIGKPYAGLLYLEGFDKKYMRGLVRFIYENEKEFVSDPKVWDEFIESMQNYGKEISRFSEKRFHLVSKETYLLSVNYRLERDRKWLAPGVEALKDIEVSYTTNPSALDSIDYLVVPKVKLRQLDESVRDQAILIGRVVDKYDMEEEIYAVPSSLVDNTFGLARLSDFLRILYTGKKEERQALKRALGNNSAESVELNLPFLCPAYDLKRKVWVVPSAGEGITQIRASVGKSSFSVVYDADAPPVVESLRSNARPVVYASGILDGSNVVVDEIDQSSSYTSEVYRVIKSIKSPLKVASTGTISNGSVESVVELLGLIADIRYDAVEKLRETVRELYGTFTVSDKGDGFYKAVFDLFHRARGKPDALKELVNAVERADSADSLLNSLIQIGQKEGLLSAKAEQILYKLKAGDKSVKRLVSSFADSFAKFLEESVSTYSESSYAEKVMSALVLALRDQRALKTGVGTLNPIGFVKSIDLGVSLSLMTRELLKGVKEEIKVLDNIRSRLSAYEKDRQWAVSPEESLIGEADYNLLDLFPENAQVAEAMQGYTPVSLRAMWDSLNANATVGENESIKTLVGVQRDFSVIMSLTEEVQRELLKDERYALLVSKSGKTTDDDLVSMVREYILNNFSFPEEDIEEVSPELVQKRQLAVNVVQALRSAEVYVEEDHERKEKRHFLLMELNGERMRIEIKDLLVKSCLEEVLSVGELFQHRFSVDVNLVRGRSWDPELFKDSAVMSYKLKLASAKEDEIVDILSNRGYIEGLREDISALKNVVITPSRVAGLPAGGGELFQHRFSVDVNLVRGRSWDPELFKDSAVMSYKLKLASAKEDEIVDILSNRGYIEGLREDISALKNVVITPSRVAVLPVLVGDLLNLLVQRESKDMPAQVIVRVSTSQQKEFLSRLNEDFLKQHNIVLKVVSTQAELDAETARLKSSTEKLQSFVVAPAQTVSRGVDFSMFDVLVVPGTLDGKGREFTQLLARLFNSKDKHSAELRIFGSPVRYLLFSRSGDLSYKLSPTMSSVIQSELLAKAEFARSLLSGELSFISPATGKVEVLEKQDISSGVRMAV